MSWSCKIDTNYDPDAIPVSYENPRYSRNEQNIVDEEYLERRLKEEEDRFKKERVALEEERKKLVEDAKKFAEEREAFEKHKAEAEETLRQIEKDRKEIEDAEFDKSELKELMQ